MSYGWQRDKAADLATEFMADINDYTRWSEDKDALEESIFKALGEALERGRREENEGCANLNPDQLLEIWRGLDDAYDSNGVQIPCYRDGWIDCRNEYKGQIRKRLEKK